MKEMKLSCFKCHFESFFTTVANDKAGHQPVPFDITSFSFTSTMTDRPHKRDRVPFEICTSPIINLVCPQTFCIRIEFNFSWDDYNTQEKLKAKVMQNFRRQTTCITRVNCANGECCFRETESLSMCYIYLKHRIRILGR